MWSAFVCAAYAEMSGNKREQERLFNVGYKAGTEFIEGIKRKEAADPNVRIEDTEARDAPVAVLMRMGGPTTDFVIGRIFEAATGDAYDKVVKEDSSGALIRDPSKWASKEVRTITAGTKYESSNCSLIREVA